MNENEGVGRTTRCILSGRISEDDVFDFKTLCGRQLVGKTIYDIDHRPTLRTSTESVFINPGHAVEVGRGDQSVADGCKECVDVAIKALQNLTK